MCRNGYRASCRWRRALREINTVADRMLHNKVSIRGYRLIRCFVCLAIIPTVPICYFLRTIPWRPVAVSLSCFHSIGKLPRLDCASLQFLKTLLCSDSVVISKLLMTIVRSPLPDTLNTNYLKTFHMNLTLAVHNYRIFIRESCGSMRVQPPNVSIR